jgi:hypothetical protein
VTSVCWLNVVDVYTTTNSWLHFAPIHKVYKHYSFFQNMVCVMLVITCCCRWSIAWGMYGLCIAPSVGHLDARRFRCANRRPVASLARHCGKWWRRATTYLAPILNSTSPVRSCLSSPCHSPPEITEVLRILVHWFLVLLVQLEAMGISCSSYLFLNIGNLLLVCLNPFWSTLINMYRK